MGKTIKENNNAAVMTVTCPVCKAPMKVINDHWVDPLLQCQTRNCSNAKHLHRVSKIKGVKPNA